MRVWDIHPGYLNRQSLLGEHRELHGLLNILIQGKKGYSQHPETLRWVGYVGALVFRHRLLSAEMSLRGYNDKSPVPNLDWPTGSGGWPEIFIDSPSEQFRILESKYQEKLQGRIPLPVNAQQLWSHHKYSVMARSIPKYKEIGSRLSEKASREDFAELSMELISLMRVPPSTGGIVNTLQHMWGYITPPEGSKSFPGSPALLLTGIQKQAKDQQQPYLLSSTALSELACWLRIEKKEETR